MSAPRSVVATRLQVNHHPRVARTTTPEHVLPPQDLDAEAAVLSAVMLDPKALARIANLTPEDFSSGAHRLIFEACRALEARADPVDVVLVGTWLRDQGRLQQIGGTAYLHEILDASPAMTTKHIASHAASIQRKRLAREAARATEAAHARLRELHEDPATVIPELVAELQVLEQRHRPRSTPSPADQVRALARSGPLTRFETGLRTFDDACRGGLPGRRLVILGGAPGAGKTSLSVSLGWQWTKGKGAVVGILAQDEGPEGVFMRLGQLEGFDRRKLEDERDPATLASLAAIIEATPLLVFDGDTPDGTVERAAAAIAARAAGCPAVLIADSIQTVRAEGTDEAASPRERVDAVLRALRLARDRHGLLIIAPCELARGSYRERDRGKQIDDLAAFKESGSIEYAAQTALVLRSVPDEKDLIDVTVPKNRALGRDPFRLRINRETTAFEEVELPAPSERRPARPQSTEDDAQRVLGILIRNPGTPGKKALRARVHAECQMSTARIDGAIDLLEAYGAFIDKPEKGKPRWFGNPSALPTTAKERHDAA